MKRGHLLLAAALLLAGCASMDAIVKKAGEVAADKGYITQDQAKTLEKAAVTIRKSAEEFSESEEYYIGRAVAAA